jgi:hypothetical protein
MKQGVKNLFFWLLVIGGIVIGLSVFGIATLSMLPDWAEKTVDALIGVAAIFTGFMKLQK